MGAIAAAARIRPGHPLTRCRIVYPPDPRTKISGPFAHQLEFHQAEAHYRLLEWGVRSGKTFAGAVEALVAWSRFPGRNGLMFAPTYRMAETVQKRAFWNVCRAFRAINGFSPVVRYWAGMRIFSMVGGGEIHVCSADDPDKFRGNEYAWAWGDEVSMMLGQDDIKTVLVGRMSGAEDFRCWFTTTPRGRHGLVSWIEDECAAGNPDYWMSTHASTDNPTLTNEYLKQFGAYSLDLYRREVLGQNTDITGTVYGRFFSRRTHVRPFPHLAEMRADTQHRRWVTYGAVDWGDVYNHLLVIAHDKLADEDWIIDECLVDNATRDYAADTFGRRILACPLLPESAHTDPTGKQWNERLKRVLGSKVPVRYTWQARPREIAYGVELVKRRLQAADGKIRIWITPEVAGTPANRSGGRGICTSLERYRHARSTDGMAVMDKYVDNNWHTHAVDTLRYSLINRMRRELGYREVQYF